MPIEVQHQPAAAVVGAAAFAAGQGQFNQQQFQNGLALTQQAMQFQAMQQQAALQAAHLNQQRQLAAAQMQMQDMQQRRAIGAQQGLAQQRNDWQNQRDQLNWANRQAGWDQLNQRNQQMQAQRFVQDAVKSDLDQRMKTLSQIGSTPMMKPGTDKHLELRSELSSIVQQKRMGVIDDDTYRGAIAQWDEKFNAEPWDNYKKDPKAEAQQAIDAATITDPELGEVIVSKGRNGSITKTPTKPKPFTAEDGSQWYAVPNGDKTEWMPKAEYDAKFAPKPTPAPKKLPPITSAEVMQEAANIKAEYESQGLDVPNRDQLRREAIDSLKALRAELDADSGTAPGAPTAGTAPPDGSGAAPTPVEGDGSGEDAPAGMPPTGPVAAPPGPGPTGPAPAGPVAPPPAPSPGSPPPAGPAVSLDPKSTESLLLKAYGDPLSQKGMSPATKKVWSELAPMLQSGGKISDPAVSAKIQELTDSINSKLGKKPVAKPPGASPPAVVPPPAIVPPPAAPGRPRDELDDFLDKQEADKKKKSPTNKGKGPAVPPSPTKKPEEEETGVAKAYRDTVYDGNEEGMQGVHSKEALLQLYRGLTSKSKTKAASLAESIMKSGLSGKVEKQQIESFFSELVNVAMSEKEYGDDSELSLFIGSVATKQLRDRIADVAGTPEEALLKKALRCAIVSGLVYNTDVNSMTNEAVEKLAEGYLIDEDQRKLVEKLVDTWKDYMTPESLSVNK